MASRTKKHNNDTGEDTREDTRGDTGGDTRGDTPRVSHPVSSNPDCAMEQPPPSTFKSDAKYHVRICTNVYCMLGGGDELFEQVCKHFGIANKQATADGLVSIEEIPCMGVCESAPVVAVNDQFYEGVTVADLPELYQELR